MFNYFQRAINYTEKKTCAFKIGYLFQRTKENEASHNKATFSRYKENWPKRHEDHYSLRYMTKMSTFALSDLIFIIHFAHFNI